MEGYTDQCFILGTAGSPSTIRFENQDRHHVCSRLGSITGTLCAPSSRDMTLLALELCNPEVALGGLGGQALVWQEEMRFPTDLEAKEAFFGR